jgi:hypothetical protein
MLNQPERVLDAFGSVLLTADPIRALMVRHQLEPRREVVRIRRKLLFEQSDIGLLQFQEVAQGLPIPWTEHRGQWWHTGRTGRLWRDELRPRRTRRRPGQNQGYEGGQRRQDDETDAHEHSVSYREGARLLNHDDRDHSSPTP